MRLASPMARVITQNASMAQLQLDSGERILISLTRKEIGFFKLGFFGFIPMYQIWGGSIDDYNRGPYKPASFTMFALNPVRYLIEDLSQFRSIEEMQKRLSSK